MTNEKDKAREIIKKISDAALELAFTRHDLESDEFDETNYPDIGGTRQREQAFEKFVEEIKEDTLNCLTGDDTGCLDPEELDESNCELLWLESALATVRAEEREAAFKEIRARVEAVNPHLTFGSANGSMMKKCILAEIESAENRKGEG